MNPARRFSANQSCNDGVIRKGCSRLHSRNRLLMFPAYRFPRFRQVKSAILSPTDSYNVPDDSIVMPLSAVKAVAVDPKTHVRLAIDPGYRGKVLPLLKIHQ